MGSYSRGIRGLTAAVATATGTLTALPAAAFADANSTFVPCSAGGGGLTTAITNANNGTGPRAITLAPGCAYFLTGTTGLPNITADITLRAKDATIRRFSATTFSLVRINSGGRLKAEGITFAGGDASSGGGGGFFVDTGGVLQLSDSRVTQNVGGFAAGGILINPGGTARLFDTVVNNNTATDGAGITNNGTLTVVGGLIGFNTAATNGGGLSSTGRASLTSTDVVHNTAVNGGGIRNSGAGNLTLRKSRIQFNTATGSGSLGGGGIANSATLQVLQSRLSDNRAGTGGIGGALFHSGGTATIRESTLTRNAAGNGGAVANTGAAGSVTVVRSLITNNRPNNCAPVGSVPGCSG